MILKSVHFRALCQTPQCLQPCYSLRTRPPFVLVSEPDLCVLLLPPCHHLATSLHLCTIMVILRNIPRILSPELLSVLARMGHGDEIGKKQALISATIRCVSCKYVYMISLLPMARANHFQRATVWLRDSSTANLSPC